MKSVKDAEQYVSVARAAAILGTTPAAVSELLQRNEIESLVLIQTDSLRSYAAGAR